MSALPPKADIETRSRDVRFVPQADILRSSKDRRYSMTGADYGEAVREATQS
jgi:hypothetical protein